MGKRIFCFSHTDWFWIKNRPQHIPEKLSQYFDVVFFALVPPFSRSHSSALTPQKLGDRMQMGSMQVNPRFKVIRQYNPFPRRVSQALHDKLVGLLIRRQIRDSQVIWLMHPPHIRIVRPYIKNKILIYDCMDDHDHFNVPAVDRNLLVKTEPELIEKADLVFCTSEKLVEKCERLFAGAYRKTVLVKNGVDEDLFDPKRIIPNHDPDFQRILNRGRKVVGYIGSISEWMDWGLIMQAAEKYRESVDFVFIGPVHAGRLPDAENIFILGPRPYEQMPSYLALFNAALLPFKVSPLIRAVNPVKIYEYLAMGINTIACRYQELENLGFDIALYSNEDEFLQKLSVALACPPTNETISLRRHSIMKETWKARAGSIENRIMGLFNTK